MCVTALLVDRVFQLGYGAVYPNWHLFPCGTININFKGHMDSHRYMRVRSMRLPTYLVKIIYPQTISLHFCSFRLVPV